VILRPAAGSTTSETATRSAASVSSTQTHGETRRSSPRVGRLNRRSVIFVVSDFFDFSVYIDAADDLIESWYVERFLRLRQTAFRDPASYFHRYATLSEDEARATGLSIWRSINLVNLKENILPTRQRADLILRKGADHAVETVALRKL